MAIQTRLYLAVATTPSFISRFVGPGVSIIAQTGAYVKVQYDDATMDTTTLDQLLGQQGYIFNAVADTLLDLPTELKEIIPRPEGNVVGNSTHVTTALYDGASVLLDRPATMDRVVLRVQVWSTPGTLSMLFFQRSDGSVGDMATPVPLVASVRGFNPLATGGVNFKVPFFEGTVTFRSGLVYVLYGRDSAAGSLTLRALATTARDLQTGNVEVDTHPTNFTTSIPVVAAPGAPPATFTPALAVAVPVVPSAADIYPDIRFFKT